MPSQLTPSPNGDYNSPEAVPYAGAPFPPVWPAGQSRDESEGIPWGRYVDALKRHILMELVLVVLGSAAGLYVASRVRPIYDAQATIWISNPAQQSGSGKDQQLVSQTSWVDLLRSFAIVDPVVSKLKLNLAYRHPGDSAFFQAFQSRPSIRAGAYTLKIQPGNRYLLSTGNGIAVEHGAIGDSVGRKVGFGWVPDTHLLRPGDSLSFEVARPRIVAAGLLSQMRAVLPDDGQFLRITLSGTNPQRTAETLNAWMDQFVSSSNELKKRNLLEFKIILSEQVGVAERELRSSESQLERFRINAITLPSEGPPGTSGVQTTRDPAIANYFQQKQTLTDIQNARVALEQIIADAKGGPLNMQAFLITLPAVLTSTPQLRAAIDDLSARQAGLRTEQQYLTDANPRIKQLKEAIRLLEYETIPALAQGVLRTLRAQEGDMKARVTTQSQELRAIPSRTIEEMRLVRQVAASEKLYDVLKARYDDVALAETQTTPDLSVLDPAGVPGVPSSNDAPRFFLLAVLASIGLAAAVALLHDRLDQRFRYPEQATHELGLTIAGTVPRFHPSKGGEFRIETLSQAVESFRTLRLAVRYEFPRNAPIVLAVSSANSGDGKSLVSSNLALAFAGAGHRTLLIDGDVRRGSQHSTFDIPVMPGLVEFLGDKASWDSVVKATSSENLFLLPRGARRNGAPELLVSDQMAMLIQLARQRFEVVIIDAPPFVAGVDAYALGAAAGSMLVILRQGVTDRKLTAAKLTVLDRLPIRILGTVLNGVPAGGLYRYYGTDYTYQAGKVTDPTGDLATPTGLVLRA